MEIDYKAGNLWTGLEPGKDFCNPLTEMKSLKILPLKIPFDGTSCVSFYTLELGRALSSKFKNFKIFTFDYNTYLLV